MIEITKDTIIGDILDVAPQTAPIFLSIGMHCLGCPSSRGETVEEACAVHGVDVDKLLELVNERSQQAHRRVKTTCSHAYACVCVRLFVVGDVCERRLELTAAAAGCVADMVPEGCRLADVGTDHGYLPVCLLQRRRDPRALLPRICGAEPLEHARPHGGALMA